MIIKNLWLTLNRNLNRSVIKIQPLLKYLFEKIITFLSGLKKVFYFVKYKNHINFALISSRFRYKNYYLYKNIIFNKKLPKSTLVTLFYCKMFKIIL